MNIKDILETFPVLDTKRLKLVQITPVHTDELYEIYANENVMKYYDSYPHKSKDETRIVIKLFEQRFQDKSGIRWAITLKDDQKLIGTIGFNSFKPNSNANIGYDLNENYWNKGILTEALESVSDFGFDALQIHRIEAMVNPGNIASEKVLLKNNFMKEGTLREREFWKGKHQTILIYGKLETDR